MSWLSFHGLLKQKQINLTNVYSNQTAFVWKVTAGFGTSFVLCRSYLINWEMVDDLNCEWVVAVCAADENQSNVAFCVRDPKAPLIISFEKLCVSPSHKFTQSEIITSCFFFRFTSRPLCFFMTSCCNFGSCKIRFVYLSLFGVENLLIWTDAVFSGVFPTHVTQCLLFFCLFFF